MKETIIYSIFEEHLESFPAENYVDYMTNVMTVPERHTFYVPRRGCTIVCIVQRNLDCISINVWGLIDEEVIGVNPENLLMDAGTISRLIQLFPEFQRYQTCKMCDEELGSLMRKMS